MNEESVLAPKKEDAPPVPDDLRGCHRVVSQTRKALEKGAWEHNGRLRSIKTEILNVTVSRASLHRALRIMQAVVSAVETRGWSLVIQKDQSTYSVKVGEEEMGVRLGERTKRFEVGPKRPPHESFLRQHEFKPTGILYLDITDYVADAGRHEWSEGKRQPLEEMVPDFIDGLAAAAEARIKWHREHAERDRQWKEAAIQREKLESRKRRELERRQRLLKQAEEYAEAQSLRKLVADFRSSENLPVFWTAEARDLWAGWAEQIADKLDPFRNGYFSEKLAQTEFEPDLRCLPTQLDDDG